MGEGDLPDQFQRCVILEIAVFHDAAMAVRRIFAGAYIRNYDQLRDILLQGSYGFLHETIFGEGARAAFIFGVGHAEQKDCGNSEIACFDRFFYQAVD